MKTLDTFNSLIELMDYFRTDEKCEQWLAEQRTPACPYCGSVHIKMLKGATKRTKCYDCNSQFGVKVGTIFHKSPISLRKWFVAIYLVTAHKKGISSYQLGRDIKVTQKTAWFMLQRIRECFNVELPEPVQGIVEVDETYVGGDNKNKSNSKRKELHKNGAQTGANHKTPVLGVLERSGDVKAVVLDKAMGKTIKPILNELISEKAVVVTDGFGAYSGINKSFAGHFIVSHDKSEYAKGIYHTNTVEGFWSLLKRMIIGIYHAVSPKHLQRYVNEMAFRYNTREEKEGDRFRQFMGSIERRITYVELIAA